MTMDAKMKEATTELTATNWMMELQQPKEDSKNTQRSSDKNCRFTALHRQLAQLALDHVGPRPFF